MDSAWRLPKSAYDRAKLREAVASVVAPLDGITARVEDEGDDGYTAFFAGTDDEGEPYELELSVYDLGQDGIVLSLELDAADNARGYDAVFTLAEDLAECLDGELLDL